MRLEFDHVTHTYQAGSPFQATAIQDVSLTIEGGEFVALIGHTGSGKSTLAQHMNALLTPTQGRVLLDGRDINEKGVSKKETRQKIGLVFQYAETQLFEETVAKDVAFGPRNLGLSQEEIDSRVREALERVGLPFGEIAEKSPFELSGGQMRRVAIAGVIAMRPEMLVLDEPAAGLDPMGREELLKLIRGFHESGTTVVMISHSMDDVANSATRIVVMEKGRLAIDGTPDKVFAQTERLLGMDLDVPEVCKLSLALRQVGYDFPMCYRTGDAYEALAALLKGGRDRA
ncbi:MAG: energy-coupling factor transporter ATPase [Clostridia bacterium]|nr:energy-coupling factor transporter ATPase [Clostridia bacterium]